MSSKRKLDSARANGAKSHGPVTPEGRKISSMNALKHGLNARTVVLPNEDEDEYNFLLESYVQRLQPADLVEMDLVVEMANARWRQRRCNKTETGLFEEQMVKQKEQLAKAYTSYPEAVELSFTFRRLSESGSLANLNRTQSQLERAYTHALRDLLRLQQLRKSNLDAGKKDGEKRTESQDRSPSANLRPQWEFRWIAPEPPPSAELTSPGSSDPPERQEPALPTTCTDSEGLE